MAGEREPVARAVDVLIWLSANPSPPWSVRSVARAVETSPTTIHRIFRTFEDRGLLARDGSGAYVPGLELYRISHAIAGRLSPVRLVRHHLDALAAQFTETVMLGAYFPQRHAMMYIDVIQSAHPVRYIIEPNRWIPIHAGATGLGILAFLPEDERREIYAEGLEPLTDLTITSQSALEERTAQIREVGWVCTHGQRTIGAVGTAAPVYDAQGAVFGDVCVSVPEQRFDDRETDRLGEAVARTAAAVTLELKRAGYLRGAS